jgi:hypothetical protein
LLQSTYLPQTQQLLQNPAAPTALYSTALLTGYINTARGQLAGEGKCIRAFATLTTVPGQQVYPFSSLNLGVPATTGIQGAININTVWAVVGNGQVWLQPREWEWFGLYYLNNIIPNQALPMIWTQYGQGAAPPGTLTGASFGGSLYLSPIPDQAYTLNCDCTCYPIPLVADGDVEAIPYLWTDAVPFFAAYYALLSAQTSMRTRDAKEMLQSYEMFMARARMSANPMQLGGIYQGAPDEFKAARMGASAPQAAQGGIG